MKNKIKSLCDCFENKIKEFQNLIKNQTDFELFSNFFTLDSELMSQTFILGISTSIFHYNKIVKEQQYLH